MFKEAAADLAEVWLLLVELLLQPFQELPLEPVDLLNVAEDGTELLFCEHICPLAALFDVTLWGKKNKNPFTLLQDVLVTSFSDCVNVETSHICFPWSNPDLADVFQVFDVVPLCAHDLIDDVGPHLLLAGQTRSQQ